MPAGEVRFAWLSDPKGHPASATEVGINSPNRLVHRQDSPDPRRSQPKPKAHNRDNPPAVAVALNEAGFDVAATAAPSAGDARHLAWMRDHTGQQFLAGVVLHTGPASFPLGDRLWADPISSLWS